MIVSGGVFNSPQLLQLSGIGPGALLQEMGIPVMHDLPAVGRHLQDHFYVRLAFRCTRPITMNEMANSLPRKAMALAQYMLFRSGPLAANGVTAGAFARSDPRLERPDLQFNFSPWSYASRDATRRGGASVSRLQPERGASAARQPRQRDASRAPIRWPPPAIRFNFLETQSDLQALTAGMRLARKFARQPALAPYVAEELLPGRTVNTDAEFEANIRMNANSNLHPVGTCRMGPEGDTVVDARLRVHGIGRLRVVDAAIMPTVPGRQHQCAVDHDRREGGRHDPGRCARREINHGPDRPVAFDPDQRCRGRFVRSDGIVRRAPCSNTSWFLPPAQTPMRPCSPPPWQSRGNPGVIWNSSTFALTHSRR